MKAIVKYTLSSYSETIDLEDYGHDEDRTWDDLTRDEQIEIEDSLREEKVVHVSIEDEDEY